MDNKNEYSEMVRRLGETIPIPHYLNDPEKILDVGKLPYSISKGAIDAIVNLAERLGKVKAELVELENRQNDPEYKQLKDYLQGYQDALGKSIEVIKGEH